MHTSLDAALSIKYDRYPMRAREPGIARTRLIVSRMAALALSSVVSVVAGMGRELIVAARFGTSDALECYVAAAQVVLYLVSFGAAPLALVIVPAYVVADETSGKHAADVLVRKSLGLGFAVLLLLTSVAFFFSPAVTALASPGFDAAKREATTAALRMLAPGVLMSGATTLYAALLNARERFAAAAVAPVLRNVTFAMVILVTPGRSADSLVLAGLSGFVVELAFIAAVAYRRGVPLLPTVPRRDAEIARVGARLAHVTAATGFFALTPLVDQAYASLQGAGSVGTLAYGTKLVSVLLTIVVSAVTTVLLPELSRRAARGDFAGIRAVVKLEVRAVLALGTVLALLIASTAELTVSLVFERGAFGAETTARVAGVHAVAAIQIPFYLLSSVLTRTLNAMGAGRYFSFSGAALVLVNIAVGAWLSSIAGVRGVAGTASVLYAVSSLGAYLCIRYNLSQMRAHDSERAHGAVD